MRIVQVAEAKELFLRGNLSRGREVGKVVEKVNAIVYCTSTK